MLRAFLSIVLLAAGLAAGPPAGAATQGDIDRLTRALDLVESRDFGRARTAIGGIEDPLARKLARWRMYAFDDSGAAFEQIAAFVRDNPEWPWRGRLIGQAEKAMPGDMAPGEVLAWFEQRPPRTVDGVMRRITALEDTGRVEEAKAAARAAWASPDVTTDDERAFHKRFGKWLGPEDHYARVDMYLWRTYTNSAARVAQRYGVPARYKSLIKARTALLRGKGPSLKGAERLLSQVDDTLRQDPGLLYAEARWHRVNERNDHLRSVLMIAPADPAHAGLWWRERHILARSLVFDDGDPESAYEVLENHRLHDGADFLEAEWTAGWVALRFLDDPEAAFLHFNRVFIEAGTPISQARGAYWLGRAAEALHNQGWATQWYVEAARHGTTYYGQFAAARLEDPAVTLADAPGVAEARRPALADRELARAARILHDAGREDLVYHFLTALRLASNDAGEYRSTAELALELDQPNVAVRVGKDAARRGMILINAAYPKLQMPDVDGHLPLVRGLIRQESEFNAAAVSPAGARGLMQLMPATAKRVARDLRMGYSRGRLTADPDYNVRLGAAYLRQMLDRYDGLMPMALAAYNAGPHRVDAWIETYGDPRREEVDIVDWVEAIPYGETRNYVQRVLESMQVYLTLAGEPTVAATDVRTYWRLTTTAQAEAGDCPDRAPADPDPNTC